MYDLSVRSWAPGKVIICGEHFVVHGGLAIAAALNRGVEVEAKISEDTVIDVPQLSLCARPPSHVPHILKPLVEVYDVIQEYLNEKAHIKVTVRSDLPVGAGLGSSSAVAVAFVKGVIAALGHKITKSDLIDLAMVSERIVHGNPSGIDVKIAADGGVILFGGPKSSKMIDLPQPIPLIVGYCGQNRDTAKMISLVAEFKSARPVFFQTLVNESSKLAESAATSLQLNDLETLGSIMQFHQLSLSLLGVSISKLDLMIDLALQEGALGSKLTGAGGGGCMIAISRENKRNAILNALNKLSKAAFIAEIPQKGVRVWSSEK